MNTGVRRYCPMCGEKTRMKKELNLAVCTKCNNIQDFQWEELIQ